MQLLAFGGCAGARPLADTLADASIPGVVYEVLNDPRGVGVPAQAPADQQRVILAEHGAIGMAFGATDNPHDIRLARHGLDTHDNDFVVGLIGKDLHPLSAVAQAMRKTQQTALSRSPRALLRRPRRLAGREASE